MGKPSEVAVVNELDQPSVIWGSFTVHDNVTAYQSVNFHLHDGADEDSWLFAGTKNMVFNNLLHPVVASSMQELIYGYEQVRALRSDIQRRQLQSNPANCACTYKRTTEREKVCDDHFMIISTSEAAGILHELLVNARFDPSGSNSCWSHFSPPALPPSTC